MKKEREEDIFTTWLDLARGRSSGSFRFIEETHMRKDVVLECMMLRKKKSKKFLCKAMFFKNIKKCDVHV
ncbi:MAG: hypothetical protein RDU30_00835 [Desulfovibrionaceae bacterium]|nr:hypothetical protein [Desulfovibrionaceae bacterium]